MKKTWLMPSIIALLVAYGVLYIWRPGGVSVLSLITDSLSVLFALLASFLAVSARRMFDPGTLSRRAWLFFGIGMAAMATAELLWMYYQVVLNQTLPFPSPADLLWAISYVPILASLILQYRALGVHASRRRKLSVAAPYFGVLLIGLAITVWSGFSGSGQIVSPDVLLNALYLAGDMFIVIIATLSLLFLWKGLVSKPWQYMVISVLLFVIADVTFSYGSANDLYATGTNFLSGVVDVFYLAAYALAAAGGYRQLTLRFPA